MSVYFIENYESSQILFPYHLNKIFSSFLQPYINLKLMFKGGVLGLDIVRISAGLSVLLLLFIIVQYVKINVF